MAEIAHPIFDQKVRSIFDGDVNLNLQLHKCNMRNGSAGDVCCIFMQTVLLSEL